MDVYLRHKKTDFKISIIAWSVKNINTLKIYTIEGNPYEGSPFVGINIAVKIKIPLTKDAQNYCLEIVVDNKTFFTKLEEIENIEYYFLTGNK